LTEADIPSFEEWLEATPYPQSRKDELTKQWNKCNRQPCQRLFSWVKSFIKDETYPEYKYPRSINSRCDQAKCYFGPVVQAVSDRLFSKPDFIKKVPVPERPLVIRDTLLSSGEDDDYIFTDYTAFEAHFIKEIMEVTQFHLFRHCLKGTSYETTWLPIYEDVVGGVNHLQYKNFLINIAATRMSGEMDTSLSNGFSNLMLFKFLVSENGGTSVGFVEGDDGLFRVSPRSAAPTAEQFKDLGFTIKIGTTRILSEASFCGQVYDMTDLKVVTDPLEVLARVGWTNKKYVRCNDQTAMMLLRAKGYSLVYQYLGCPILDVLGRRILELTESVNIPERIFANLDQWERAKLRAATQSKLPPYEEPGEGTRQLVHKLYGITVKEQKEIEELFSNIDLGHHPFPCIEKVHSSWTDYYNTYHTEFEFNDPCWLLKSERWLLDKLQKIPNCEQFVRSLD